MVRIFQRLEVGRIAEEVLDAVTSLSRSGHGAIIAIQQEIGLDEYAETGSSVDARVSAEILKTIFAPYSPLHDGAVLISGDQIRSAGAILPLTQSQIDHSLGTRHRAAIGLSEETDAIVIVISEETSQVAVAIEGRLERDLGAERLREILLGRLPALDTALEPTGV
tara:strand:+ start:3683 stop:4180 length:498 start_codon:yes stop_codon:yes gene_type:complete